MPKGHCKRIIKESGFKWLKKRTHIFRASIRFDHKKSNPRVWEYLKARMEKDIEDYTEIAENIIGMSDSELDMLSTKGLANDIDK